MELLLSLSFGLILLSFFAKRIYKRLPEEMGQRLLAEATEFGGLGRASLYDNFLVIRSGATFTFKIISYKSIQRVGVGHPPVSVAATPVCIDYKDDKGVAHLAQFKCTESKEFLNTLAEQLDLAGKGYLVNWKQVSSETLTSV